jgi:hypothetical protein
MKRLLACLLALLLPLQLAWGAAAAYCQHETAPDGRVHFGHHQHVHDVQKDDNHQHAKMPGGKVVGDHDCGYCNVTATAVMPGIDAAPAAQPADGGPQAAVQRRHLSPPPRAPDRPQWTSLV